MNYPAAELRSIEMDFSPFNPDAEHRGILLIKIWYRNFLEAPDTVDMLERLHTRSPEMRQYITEIFT